MLSVEGEAEERTRGREDERRGLLADLRKEDEGSRNHELKSGGDDSGSVSGKERRERCENDKMVASPVLKSRTFARKESKKDKRETPTFKQERKREREREQEREKAREREKAKVRESKRKQEKARESQRKPKKSQRKQENERESKRKPEKAKEKPEKARESEKKLRESYEKATRKRDNRK